MPGLLEERETADSEGRGGKSGKAMRGSETGVGGTRERGEPYGVAVWEIADGDGQRARNRWALRRIITASQKVMMNYSKLAMQPGNTDKAVHTVAFSLSVPIAHSK